MTYSQYYVNYCTGVQPAYQQHRKGLRCPHKSQKKIWSGSRIFEARCRTPKRTPGSIGRRLLSRRAFITRPSPSSPMGKRLVPTTARSSVSLRPSRCSSCSCRRASFGKTGVSTSTATTPTNGSSKRSDLVLRELPRKPRQSIGGARFIALALPALSKAGRLKSP